MINILIADDEAVERKAMEKMITKGVENVTIAGEAENGRKAIELVRTLQPDIVMMDIKMPGIDGIEAVQTIHRDAPDTKFIMVTAYDTFEYARKVMKEGVKEYLLKPSHKQDIIATVKRVVEEIETERQTLHEQQALKEQLDRLKSFAESEWVVSLLLDHVHDTEVNEWQSFLDYDIQAAYAIVCRVIYQEGAWSKQVQADVYQWIKAILEQKFNCLVGPMSGNQIPVLVSIHQEQRMGNITVQSEAIQQVKAFTQTFNSNFPKHKVKAGIGTPVVTPDQFMHSYNEALIALDQVNEHANYLYYHSSLNDKTSGDHLFRREKALLDAVKSGDRAQTSTAFELYFRELTDEAGDDLATIETRLQELWVLMVRLTEDMGSPIHLSLNQPKTSSVGQLKAFVEERLMQTVERFEEWKQHNIRGLIHQAKAYIQTHFTESISLEDVAMEVELSPYYFSKIFKEHEGMTFVEYLTDSRISAAKQLLTEQRLSQKEICYDIGYRDPNYFSRVFKKKTGVSPSEFRSGHRLGHPPNPLSTKK
ncbi:response regulator transcription factor [Tuberibacillus sp. Marseille-P3662]|uniref:response regulator transcription factor n=1 Tax=Tuberibacillus sp. Marseille-P3662 TaxID=1965358 RepID=UPI000A1CD652|nr:response regulator [Tuberibacillus sp. Marseille-P3662]